MAGNKVRLGNEVRRFDWFLAKTQVGNSESAGFFGVIRKICLSIHVGIVTNNFDSLFVSANCTVRTKAKEFTLNSAFGNSINFMTDFQGKEGYIVFDANCEVVFRSACKHIVKYGKSHCRSKVF